QRVPTEDCHEQVRGCSVLRCNGRAGLRRPWAEQLGRPAWSHHSRNLLPNPASVKARPNSLTRNVNSPHGEALMIRCNAGRIGNVSCFGFRFRPLYCVNVILPSRTCWRPKRVISERRCPVNSKSESASRAFVPIG